MQAKDEKRNAGHLKHPGREEWMAHLYGETAPEEKVRLTAHLKDCADCRSEVAGWQAAMEALDEYKISPGRRVASGRMQAVLKWGIAAALMLSAGFGAGRLALMTSTNPAELRASLKSEIRTELQAELNQRQEQQQEENKLVLTTLAKLEADHAADYDALRKDLETMAVLTQDSFQQTHQQIVTLAGFSQPDTKTLDQ
jgi:hypothetical protein